MACCTVLYCCVSSSITARCYMLRYLTVSGGYLWYDAFKLYCSLLNARGCKKHRCETVVDSAIEILSLTKLSDADMFIVLVVTLW